MPEKTPYRIYLPEEVIERLGQIAGSLGEKSGNVIAADIIVKCLPIYLKARSAFDHVLASALSQLAEEPTIELGKPPAATQPTVVAPALPRARRK